jgi:hypothetical protein
MSSAAIERSAALWQEAIDDATNKLKRVAKTSRRAEQLRSAISTFKANLDRGMPWPGEDGSAGADRCHRSAPY